jgi:subtilisin family serine protease
MESVVKTSIPRLTRDWFTRGVATLIALAAAATLPAQELRPAPNAALEAIFEQNRTPDPTNGFGKVPLSQVVIKVAEGVRPDFVFSAYGVRPLRRFISDASTYVVETGTVDRARSLVPILEADRAVQYVYQDHLVHVAKHAFTPNDPFYNPNNPSPGYYGQWHLRNQIGGGIDVNILNGWANDYTGTGVVVGILDDGIQIDHPDLSPNYSAANSYDFADNDTNPSPVFSNDNHGTAVSGVAVSRGGNGIGVTGASPHASLAGIRLPFSGTWTYSMHGDAIRFRSTGATPTIDIKNHSYGYTTPFSASSPDALALQESTAAGTIHVWSAGNARGTALEDTNRVDNQNESDVITVAALGDHGQYAYYSSFGACVTVTAPSSHNIGITTTDRTGNNGYNTSSDPYDPLPNLDYTVTFGGTSSSAPLVAGILAQVKQVQPNLNTRFAKHLLARTSDVVHAGDSSESSDAGWRTNAAGIEFNQNYGFGNINADALIEEAQEFSGVTPLQVTEIAQTAVNQTIPDNNINGITANFNVTSTTPLEEVEVVLNINHTNRGQLDAYLISPAGTGSRLFMRNSQDTGANIVNWRFVTNAFWGENPQGVWVLRVRDRTTGTVGTWSNFAVRLRQGTLIANTPTDGASFIGQSVPEEMEPGKKYEVSVTFRNDGTTNWTRSKEYALWAQNPAENTTWTTQRVRLNSGETVAPGAQRTFTFNVTAPDSVGDYDFQWQMRNGETLNYFGEMSDNVVVPIRSSYDGTFVSQKVPLYMTPGRRYYVSVTFQNTGVEPWSEADLDYLVSQNPYANNTWSVVSAPIRDGTVVEPGDQYTFSFRIRAPSTAGVYNFQWRMRNGTLKINHGEFSPNVAIPVSSNTLNSQYLGQSVPNTVQAGQTFPVTVTMRNTGTAPWTRTENFVLASEEPFANTTWGQNTVRLTLSENIANGQQKVFSWNAKAPTTPGTYKFRWRMRYGNAGQSFGNFSQTVNINVTP